jgi:hypothetical protein
MKTIKFFSFVLLVSLAWVACKNTNTATEAETAAVMADSVFMSTKQAATTNLSALGQALATKVAELEAALATATDATKADLTTQLNTFKQYQADLQSASTKVAEATAENWASVATEVENVHMSVKSALTAQTAQTPTAVTGQGGSQLTN